MSGNRQETPPCAHRWAVKERKGGRALSASEAGTQGLRLESGDPGKSQILEGCSVGVVGMKLTTQGPLACLLRCACMSRCGAVAVYTSVYLCL